MQNCKFQITCKFLLRLGKSTHMYQMLHISCQYLTHISSIKTILQQSFKFGKNMKTLASLLPLSQKSLHCVLWSFWFWVLIPSPFWTFYTFWDTSLGCFSKRIFCLKNGRNEQSFSFSIQSELKQKRIMKNFGPYVVHFKRRDSPYVIHFKCRDSPYVVHFICKDCPYVVHFKCRDYSYV